MRTIGWACVVIGLFIIAGWYANNMFPYGVKASAQSQQGQHSILGDPTISADQINKIYCLHHSPLCGLDQQLYDLGVQAGIDPVWAVAISFEESSLGTTGEATKSLSIGNFRCLDQEHYGDLGTWCQGGYAHFHSWVDGFKAFYRLLKLLYIPNGKSTIETIIPTWAPTDDGNNPDHYIKVVLAAANLWRSGSTDLPQVA